MPSSTIEVDAFLCDSIESTGGKLYALGAGWNAITAGAFPARHGRIGIGLVMRVPYTATNQMHEFVVYIRSEDGATLPLGDAGPETDPRTVEDGKVVKVGGQFNVGRPPTLSPGDDQVVPVALQFDGVEFPNPGRYEVVVQIDKTEMKALSFRLNQAHPQQFGVAPS